MNIGNLRLDNIGSSYFTIYFISLLEDWSMFGQFPTPHQILKLTEKKIILLCITRTNIPVLLVQEKG